MRRPWALPLLPLYGAGVLAKNLLWNARKPKRLAWPVISVGSLSAGGAGKTPVVMMLADLFSRHGVAVDVLSRGYGRGSGVVEEVDAAGEARRFGDEPLEMARKGLRVFVGADRFAAGMFAELPEEDGRAAPVDHLSDDKAVAKMGHPDSWRVHLLDDGFQHRRLARSVDVVLLTLEDARDWLLPVGNLREPISSLRRADVVVLREEEAGELAPSVRSRSRAKIWVVRRELVLPVERPKRAIVFCGIARPEGFIAMLPPKNVAGVHRFDDHHAYRAEDFRILRDAAEHAGADGFCTTAKDAVKIPAEAMRMLEEIGPVVIAELRVLLVDEEAAWRQLQERLRHPARSA